MGWKIPRNTKKIVWLLMLREYGVKNQSYQLLTSKYSTCYAEFSTTKNNKTEKKSSHWYHN